MKKQILNLGKALSKVEQKQVFGGYIDEFYQTCKLYYYNSEGNLTNTVTYGGFTSGSAGSAEANASCVAAMSVGSAHSCSYDCEYDGWGN